MSTIAENLKRVQDRIAGAAGRTGRGAEEITLVAVSKTRTVEEICQAIRAGVTVIGENRVQEAEEKFPQLDLPCRRHLVGHLQRNKAKKALQLFEMIQSVDSLRIAEEIGRRASEAGRVVDVLVEVNTSGEASKFGIAPEEAVDFVGRIVERKGLRLRGLMTLGAFLPDPCDVRPCFALLRRLSEEIQSARLPGGRMDTLSMGMTHDFEAAIEEGSTMVRIGTAIFGPRG